MKIKIHLFLMIFKVFEFTILKKLGIGNEERFHRLEDPKARAMRGARLAIRLENIRLYSAVICTHKTVRTLHCAGDTF